MPGPAAKHSSTRARRNIAATAATLAADPDLQAPELPDNVAWHPQARAWWTDTWASPMAPEFDDSDQHGLLVLAMLVNDFWLATSSTARGQLAAEIRLQRNRFGLSPMDRRSLQWEIERVQQAQRGTDRRREPPAKAPVPTADPRAVLRAI